MRDQVAEFLRGVSAALRAAEARGRINGPLWCWDLAYGVGGDTSVVLGGLEDAVEQRPAGHHRDDPMTRSYAARRRTNGKSPREIRRCVKRAIARQLFKLLQRCDHAGVEIVSTS
jgi:hypothetical protein